MTYAKKLRKKWMKAPEFRTEYEALHVEFETMNSLIHARVRSGRTQAQIAERMGTTQSAVARLESGRSNPSMRTLERFADATGTRIRIWFEPVETDASPEGDLEHAPNENGAKNTDVDTRPVDKNEKEPIELPT